MALHETMKLDGGFHRPVFQSQEIFRILMNGMAHPGRLYRLSAGLKPPKPLSAQAAAILCALADGDTPIYLDAPLSTVRPLTAWLAFQTGAPVTERPANAAFAVISKPALMPTFDNFGLGSQEYPETATTIIMELPALSGGEILTLQGPGIKHEQTIAPVGLPDHFKASWTNNGKLFPRGVDLILTAADALICLPRTSRLVAHPTGKE